MGGLSATKLARRPKSYREYADVVRAGEGNEPECLAAIETKIDFYREQIS